MVFYSTAIDFGVREKKRAPVIEARLLFCHIKI
jgi:hypothetical protein